MPIWHETMPLGLSAWGMPKPYFQRGVLFVNPEVTLEKVVGNWSEERIRMKGFCRLFLVGGVRFIFCKAEFAQRSGILHKKSGELARHYVKSRRILYWKAASATKKRNLQQQTMKQHTIYTEEEKGYGCLGGKHKFVGLQGQ